MFAIFYFCPLYLIKRFKFDFKISFLLHMCINLPCRISLLCGILCGKSVSSQLDSTDFVIFWKEKKTVQWVECQSSDASKSRSSTVGKSRLNPRKMTLLLFPSLLLSFEWVERPLPYHKACVLCLLATKHSDKPKL